MCEHEANSGVLLGQGRRVTYGGVQRRERERVPIIAIIGAGRMGNAHAKAWQALGHGASIRYVCASSPGHRLAHAPLARCADLDTILRDAQVDVVSVCTPTDTHFEIASRTLRAGKNVMLEKPLARTVRQGEALRDLAAGSPGILMVAQVVRFFRGYQRLHETVRAGAIGRIRFVKARRFAAADDRPAWLTDEKRSGGMLLDFAVHDFDQLGLLLRGPFAASAVRLRSGTVETTVEYRGGGRGHVLTDWSMPEGFPFTASLKVMGDVGFADYSFTAGTDAGRLSITTAAECIVVSVDRVDPFVEQARYFLDCVTRGERPVEGSPESSLLALRVAIAAGESLATGDRVVFDAP